MHIFTIVYDLVASCSVVADSKKYIYKYPSSYPPKQWQLKMQKKGKHPSSGHFLVCPFWATLKTWWVVNMTDCVEEDLLPLLI